MWRPPGKMMGARVGAAHAVLMAIVQVAAGPVMLLLGVSVVCLLPPGAIPSLTIAPLPTQSCALSAASDMSRPNFAARDIFFTSWQCVSFKSLHVN